MSTASKVTLAGTALGTVGIVVFVHYGQKIEKAVCLTFIPNLMYRLTGAGHACWSRARHGTTTHKKGTPAGL